MRDRGQPHRSYRNDLSYQDVNEQCTIHLHARRNATRSAISRAVSTFSIPAGMIDNLLGCTSSTCARRMRTSSMALTVRVISSGVSFFTSPLYDLPAVVVTWTGS